MGDSGMVFTLPNFEGPLDLLLYLVRKHEVDIRSIPITTIADEFLDYLSKMKSLDMEITSDFILMAATLMQMKSKALLPVLDEKTASELSEEENKLYKEIEEHEVLRELTRRFKTRLNESRSQQHARAESTNTKQKSAEDIPDKLIDVFKSVLRETVDRNRVYTITSELLSVEEKMEEISREYDTLDIQEFLCCDRDRMDIIVTFLAILELIMLGRYELVSTEPSPVMKKVR
ncbi:MAG: Chromosome segregation and condensation protein ScpA [Thermotogales bacterium 46_20]|nr:MAG: Chromosome segregation and condensation protein ScpA [Thermotogales bacterium 46_20]